jgi:hypothetical protein
MRPRRNSDPLNRSQDHPAGHESENSWQARDPSKAAGVFSEAGRRRLAGRRKGMAEIALSSSEIATSRLLHPATGLW